MTTVTGRILSWGRNKGALFSILLILFSFCGIGYLLSKEWVFLALPFTAVILLWSLHDFRRVYLLMWACIPFSVELDLPGGLSTDFPAEPLMWLSCLLLIGYLYLYHRIIDFRFLFHPVFIILLIHFAWIVFTTTLSTEPLLSLKYTLAKSWYLVCFILIPILLFRNIQDFKMWGLVLLIPLVATVIIILFRHSQYGFTFDTINNAVTPIYRNHVDYACCLGVVLPYIWIMRKWFVSNIARIFMFTSIALIIAGIYFSYTRAAWLCIPLAFATYYIIKWRLMRIALPLALAAGIIATIWLSNENRYLGYAPDFEKAISHRRFDDLLSATYKMEDISTVERFYRWVAAYYMVQEKPLTGFGPSTFYSFYHSYTDRHFTTYVSDNPEKSSTHNYYLMIAVEQGLIGLAIFITLLMAVLLYGEKLYHRMTQGPAKQFLMAALVSFCGNLFILTLNDMVETDKLGSFFFFSMAVVILFAVRELTPISGKQRV